MITSIGVRPFSTPKILDTRWMEAQVFLKRGRKDKLMPRGQPSWRARTDLLTEEIRVPCQEEKRSWDA